MTDVLVLLLRWRSRTMLKATDMHDAPRLIRLDRARQARFQALYAVATAFARGWRAWGWVKGTAALLAWLWGR